MAREKVTTGDFRFCEAIIEGLIVRSDPIEKTGRRGTKWLEASILVDLYDGRQKAERDRPVFVRVRVFQRSAPNAYEVLEACNRLDRICVAGGLRIQNFESREGGIREALELQADWVVRNDRFESLANLLAQDDGNRRTPTGERGRETAEEPEPEGEDRYGPVDDPPF